MWLKAAAGAVVAAGCVVYLNGLSGMGVVGPDEPRYAAIGEAMAQSGDWITPVLWGKPWFEKPPLLYWMTGAGDLAGLGPELAPRLPVALLSLLFLIFLWWRLRAEWGSRVAVCATVLCGTTAGWLAYSHVAVTDLPMSVFFTMAVLLALPWVDGREPKGLWAAAACLGLAAMAKALVPLALFLPVLAAGAMSHGWRRLGDWLRPAPVAAFAVVALPWYILCAARNGSEFTRVLFVEQQFARFRSAGLQHVQPWWFYLPVLLLLLFPWFPLLGVVPGGIGHLWKDARVKALAGTAVFGMVLFSAAVNKLPGYLLPLTPAVCILMGLAVAEARGAPGWRAAVVATATAIGLFPAMGAVVPAALAGGLRLSAIPWSVVAWGVAAGGVAGAVMAARFERSSFAALAVAAAAGYLWFEAAAVPALDRAASARTVWRATRPQCAAPRASRNLLYGLNYYAGKQLPDCAVLDLGATRVVR
jgi:4-amino-4-deoxy-L-arabinose transferase-like glycosyltransferase